MRFLKVKNSSSTQQTGFCLTRTVKERDHKLVKNIIWFVIILLPSVGSLPRLFGCCRWSVTPWEQTYASMAHVHVLFYIFYLSASFLFLGEEI